MPLFLVRRIIFTLHLTIFILLTDRNRKKKYRECRLQAVQSARLFCLEEGQAFSLGHWNVTSVRASTTVTVVIAFQHATPHLAPTEAMHQKQFSQGSWELL